MLDPPPPSKEEENEEKKKEAVEFVESVEVVVEVEEDLIEHLLD